MIVIQPWQRVDDFFSKDITHFITVHDVDDKENKEKEGTRGGSAIAAPGGLLGSPIRLRGRYVLVRHIDPPNSWFVKYTHQ